MDDTTTLLATRLARVLRDTVALRQVTKIERLYDDTYRESAFDWLPRTAKLAVSITEAQPLGLWRQAELDLGSGPDSIYRYFPFLSYIYVDDCLQVILEFHEPHQRAIARIRVPIGSRSVVSKEPSERDAVCKCFSNQSETHASVIQLYETLLAMSRNGWTENVGARIELEDRENDLMQRLVENIS